MDVSLNISGKTTILLPKIGDVKNVIIFLKCNSDKNEQT